MSYAIVRALTAAEKAKLEQHENDCGTDGEHPDDILWMARGRLLYELFGEDQKTLRYMINEQGTALLRRKE